MRFGSTRKKFYLEGEEYVEDEPGVLIRSRSSMTRASITRYQRILLAHLNRNEIESDFSVP